MQLYFIRHGQSINNAIWSVTRSSNGRESDPDLTAVGQQQAVYLAQFLQGRRKHTQASDRDHQNLHGFGMTHIYSSLMVRAVSTAAGVANQLNLPLHGWLDLHEWGGVYEYDPVREEAVGLLGRNAQFFRKKFPELILPSDFKEGGWWDRSYEQREETRDRAKRVLQTLIQKHGGTEDRVALVSHGGFYNYLLDALWNSDQIASRFPENGIWFSLNNTGITRLDFDGDRLAVVYMNRVDFLPPGLIT
jgi:2,3-bisphosphoglycerate-dependent phosphoglycerate mutase